jgi:hypothetical protein
VKVCVCYTDLVQDTISDSCPCLVEGEVYVSEFVSLSSVYTSEKTSNVISYWSPCMVCVVFVWVLTKAVFEQKPCPKIADMKIHKKSLLWEMRKDRRSNGASTRYSFLECA